MRHRRYTAILKAAVTLLPVLVSANSAFAEPIPQSRRTDWTHTGVPGGIPNPTKICAGLSPGASSTQINNAISSCGKGGGGVVALAAGTYDVAGIEIYASNVTLRGAGAGRTTLRGSTIVNVGNGTITPVAISITGGGAQGTRVFTVTSNAGLAIDQMIEMSRDDDPDYVTSLTSVGGPRYLRQVNRITNVDGNVITVLNPLFIDFARGAAIIDKIFVATAYSGIENLTLDHSTSTGSSRTKVSYCFACWVKGVESFKSVGYHFVIQATLNFEYRDSYIHDAQTFGSNNAGLAFYGSSAYGSNSNAKVENNIFDRLFPGVELQKGSSGFYIGYNYFHGSAATADGTGLTWAMADNHGPHDMMNLWEGNIGEMFGSDGYFGGSSHGTVFRNYVTGANPRGGTGNPIILNRHSYYYNLVGNVLGSAALAPTKYAETEDACGANCDAIFRLGYPNIGNARLVDMTGYSVPGMIYPDTKVARTLLRWGNYDYYSRSSRWSSDEVPAGVPIPPDRALASSYYYSARPAWFPPSVGWPLIGPDVNGGNADQAGHAFKNPAQLCWERLGLNSSGIFTAALCYPNQPQSPTNLRVQ